MTTGKLQQFARFNRGIVAMTDMCHGCRPSVIARQQHCSHDRDQNQNRGHFEWQQEFAKEKPTNFRRRSVKRADRDRLGCGIARGHGVNKNARKHHHAGDAQS